MRVRWLRWLFRDWCAALDELSWDQYDGFINKGIVLRSPGQPPVIFFCWPSQWPELLEIFDG